MTPDTLGGFRRIALATGEVRLAWVQVGAMRRSAPSGVDTLPGWLDPAEWNEAEVLVERGRRWQWLAGRWAARLALDAAGSPDRVRVLSRDAAGRGTRPRGWRNDAPLSPVAIAHAGGLAVAAAAAGPVGVDVVARAAGLPPRLDLRRWAAAEAAYKLSPLDRFDPAAWQVEVDGDRFVADGVVVRAEGILTVVAGYLVAVCGMEGGARA